MNVALLPIVSPQSSSEHFIEGIDRVVMDEILLDNGISKYEDNFRPNVSLLKIATPESSNSQLQIVGARIVIAPKCRTPKCHTPK